ncbi:DUF4301 family protein [Flavobacterium sp. NRK F10]|uniref:DUF4301 family protein n=1 Tax=Flavobacterium sp. NRK F10 TaxID=2954931 RepID=UPI0020911A89|nr:DUF4301 family protein [Flavobacterium sp. NRK F10]MCO6175087.1 DUF4301 family protein [Flavobacterium sp. NRK F10]
MEELFTPKDIELLDQKGISIEKINQQLEYFIYGISKINLVKPATPESGIWILSKEDRQKYSTLFDTSKNQKNILKFVPASGAASRMFKFLLEFLNDFRRGNETVNAYINRTRCTELSVFLVGLKRFPFYRDLKTRVRELYPDFIQLENDEKNYYLIKTLLDKNEFDFASKAKGVLPFHAKEDKNLTPIEEHFRETLFYQKEDEKAQVHFTISKEHLTSFHSVCNQYPDIDTSFSFQCESTDTIAVTPENTPFRDENNNLFFRPGGHGALIKNLNDLEADVIFIKNIDNVSQNHIIPIFEYKKVLGGVLLELQAQTFYYLKELENQSVSEELINEITGFATQKLNIVLPKDFYKYQTQYKVETLQSFLNRPIRICGMVKNEGEPGGGPFWIKNEEGEISLQIVESSQIDFSSPKQLAIAQQATHFNPVDIICGIKNYKGEKFDLTQFVDHNTGFIVEKNKDGKPIKSYELPGLWNGAMAGWISIFVEVPLVTFNPVKTINDLLKPAHQPENE